MPPHRCKAGNSERSARKTSSLEKSWQLSRSVSDRPCKSRGG